MATREFIVLDGCATTPLASYLKALGILRLISSDANHVSGRAADPKARGWWEDERFSISTALDRDSLCKFFLHEYAPSPIIAPWNGGSGFYAKDNRDGFDPLASETVAKRFESIALAIGVASRTVARQPATERPAGQAKVELVSVLRAELPNSALVWLDAALALSGDALGYPQLLGTGGNDGRLDFTNNFMRRLVSRKRPLGLFDALSGRPSHEGVERLLGNALFDTPSHGLSSAAVGQFAPGAAGGPNATTGHEGDGNVNPWDFVLMLEGGAAFAGAATRRYQSVARPGSSFPFTVRAVGAGWGGLGAADENDARAEFWAPLWRRPARYCEIGSLLAEGRAVLNGRTVRDGLEFARAAASLGVSRGFSEFERYGFLMRAGKAFLATPIGRRSAAPSPSTQLIADLDGGGWLDRLRRVGRASGEPAAARSAIRRFEDALFDLVVPSPSPHRVERTLVALGKVCDWLAVSSKGRQAVETPPPPLSSAWVRRADDGSPEFRVAAALAGLGLPSSTADSTKQRNKDSGVMGGTSRAASLKLLPMAGHFVPINEDSFSDGRLLLQRRRWSESATAPNVVWGMGSLVSNMIAVLERRLVEAASRGLDDKPLAGAIPARLADIAAFLSEDFNDLRCASILAGLIWVRPTRLPTTHDDVFPAPVPFAYAALKPIFTCDRSLHQMGALIDSARLPVPPGLVSRLASAGPLTTGRATDAAVRVALARARASGMHSPFDPANAGGRQAKGKGSRFGAGLHANRLAAALLIPVDGLALKALLRRAYPSAIREGNTEFTEETTDAA